MGKNIIVIYGSGASYDSGYKVLQDNKTFKPPIDRGFFKSISDNVDIGGYPALDLFIKKYFPSKDQLGLEYVWSALDLNLKHITLDTYDWSPETEDYKKNNSERYKEFDFLKHGTTLAGNPTKERIYNKYKFLGDCGRDFRTLISDIYSNYNSPTNDNNSYRYLNSLLSSAGHNLLAYISFNYDCFLEDAIQLSNSFKYVGFNVNATSKEDIVYGATPIIKLHGSLNWKEDSKGFVYYNAPPYKKGNHVKTDYNSLLNWSQPAIIPPTLLKQEINDDSRSNDFFTQIILQQWKAALNILKHADSIIFVGYSFPPTDFHSRRLFQLLTMYKKHLGGATPKIKILNCIGPNDDGDQIIDDLKNNIFGGIANLEICRGFKKSIDDEIFKNFLSSI